MRVSVTEQGYASAAESFVGGNALAARYALGLADRLGGGAGMAGDDSTASSFAGSYDDAAAASVDALEQLVGALGALARLTDASLANHGRADALATLPGWARAVVGPPRAADAAVGVRLARPPSSLGADDGGPGGAAGMVLGLLQDVFWPNADTDRVRAAAGAWRTAAEGADLVAAHCDSAAAALEGERSPEIPLALAATADLRRRATLLADQLGALADACEDYAAHVDAKRAELLSLLHELVKELAIGAAIAGGLSLLSGGAATGLASGAAATRLAAAGTRCRGILASLRVLTDGTAVGLRPVAVTAGHTGRALRPMSEARVMLMEAGEGGAAQGAGAASSRLFGHLRPGWLDLHEGGGHTIARHVGKSIDFLTDRLARRPRLEAASTFHTKAQAEAAIEQTLRVNDRQITQWLKTASDSEAFRADLGRDIGGVLARGSDEIVETTKVKVVLLPDKTAPGGWRLITAHPEL